MHRIMALTLVAAMMAQAAAVVAAGPLAQEQTTGAIRGTSVNGSGQPVANATVQLRNLSTGQLVGSTTSNVSGQFSFAGLNPGTYAVEVVNATGQIIGTSASISVAAGSVATGVTVSTSAAAGAAGAGAAGAAGAGGGAAAAGLGTGAIVGIIGAAGAIGTIVALKVTASASK
jgi:hypothetical protein